MGHKSFSSIVEDFELVKAKFKKKKDIFERNAKIHAKKIILQLISESHTWELNDRHSPKNLSIVLTPSSITFNSYDRLDNPGYAFKIIKVADSSHIWGVVKNFPSLTHKDEINFDTGSCRTFFNYFDGKILEGFDIDIFNDFASNFLNTTK